MLTSNIIIDGITLTSCEIDIIRQAMMGRSRKEMADALYKKPTTLDSQMRLLYRKVRVSKISGLVSWGWQHGFDNKGNFTPPQEAPPLHPLQMAQRAKATRRKKMRTRGKRAY